MYKWVENCCCSRASVQQKRIGGLQQQNVGAEALQNVSAMAFGCDCMPRRYSVAANQERQDRIYSRRTDARLDSCEHSERPTASHLTILRALQIKIRAAHEPNLELAPT